MAKRLLVVPTDIGAGSATVCMGLKYIAKQRGFDPALFVPIKPEKDSMLDFTQYESALSLSALRQFLGRNALADAMETIVSQFEQCFNQHDDVVQNNELVIILGLALSDQTTFAEKFNVALAKSLDAKIILSTTDINEQDDQLNNRLTIAFEHFGGVLANRVLGCIINKVGAPRDMHGVIRPELMDPEPVNQTSSDDLQNRLAIFQQKKLALFGVIPWDNRLIAPRVVDIEQTLAVKWINLGEATLRRIEHITVGSRLAGNLQSVLIPGTLIVFGGDRLDILHAAALSELNGIRLAGILLTGGFFPAEHQLSFIQKALDSGLPIMVSALNTYPLITRLPYLYQILPKDDMSRYELVMSHFAEHVDTDQLKPFMQTQQPRKLSPAAFRYNLIKISRLFKKSIVLPEGNEPRTVQAAIRCAEKGIAHCILLAKPEEVNQLAETLHGSLPKGIDVIEPESIRDKYIAPFVALRKHKGMNAVRAAQLLEDNVVLGTMMLQQGDVDGLVSGAVNTTANTILPALQLIKTKPDTRLVSSVFFMCLPDQVVVYGDCAVNPDPTAEELADIAIQSADSAEAFGIKAKVAMISYSTGESGKGVDVQKVRQATQLAQQRRPDLIIDGPMQYDAATTLSVAQKKAPKSSVAGQATVFVFPDLNTGNTTYKAVQRSADVVSIGPMLQGLNKPVNDLSRGALVDDIIYTIALTAIQAINLQPE